MAIKKKKRNYKAGQQRDLRLILRVSKAEKELLESICKKRKICGSRRWSKTDVVIDALKFADGQLRSILQ